MFQLLSHLKREYVGSNQCGDMLPVRKNPSGLDARLDLTRVDCPIPTRRCQAIRLSGTQYCWIHSIKPPQKEDFKLY